MITASDRDMKIFRFCFMIPDTSEHEVTIHPAAYIRTGFHSQSCAPRPNPLTMTAVRILSARDSGTSRNSHPERVYGFAYAAHEIRFTVKESILYVKEVPAYTSE